MWPLVMYSIVKFLHDFLVTQKQVTLNDVCGYMQCQNASSATYVGRFVAFLADTVDTTVTVDYL